jgi:hypothetical protein
MALTQQEHRALALDLLARSSNYGYSSPARAATIAEAQVHATLALSADSAVEPPTPLAAVPEAEETAKPAPKRRTRKAKAEAAPAAEEAASEEASA